MIGNLMPRGTWRFPEIGFATQPITSVLELFRTHRRYAPLAGAVGAAVVAVGFAAAGYVQHLRNVADAQIAASHIESANIDLQDQLARLRDQIAASNRDLAAAQSRVVALTEEAHAHAQAAQVPPADAAQPAGKGGDKTAQMSQALHVAEAQRATLAARLSKAEADLAEQQAKQADLLGQVEQWQKKLEQLTSDRDRLKARVGELEKQSALRHAQQQQAVAAAQPTPAAPAAVSATAAPAAVTSAAAPVAAPTAAPQPEAEVSQRVAGILNAPQPAAVPAPVAAAAPAPPVAPPANPVSAAGAAAAAVGHSAVDQFARVLASAGVDVRHLFSEFGVNSAQGGPFVPLARGQIIADTALTPQKLAALQAMVKTLPIRAPLDSYEVSSPFGARGDPEDGRGEFHTGIDLRAPYDSPVYATAPGVVTYAGYRDDYGKIVEIDHGNGIATRYAHLHAFTVSVGQHVGLHQQIGYLGSTGRATGPHTHYEVVVNGEPQDPEKFFGLGRYVQPMTVPVSAQR
jgi:murein DD-endopeptidase MepM/ murein hydrolase activator NlpD